jgi:hypothetical protein
MGRARACDAAQPGQQLQPISSVRSSSKHRPAAARAGDSGFVPSHLPRASVLTFEPEPVSLWNLKSRPVHGAVYNLNDTGPRISFG